MPSERPPIRILDRFVATAFGLLLVVLFASLAIGGYGVLAATVVRPASAVGLAVGRQLFGCAYIFCLPFLVATVVAYCFGIAVLAGNAYRHLATALAD